MTQPDREFLDAFFPEFHHAEVVFEPLKIFGVRMRMSRTNAVPIEFGRLRRFAGGPSPGPGRYWSVAYDETGRDNGTLISELMGYWQPVAGLIADVRDSAYEVQTKYGSTELRRALEFVGEYREAKRRLRRRRQAGDFARTVLPLKVVWAEIEGVIDLRLPVTQRWFFDRFVPLEDELGRLGSRAGREELAIAKTRTIHDFVELLPTLVMPDIGGGAFHQAVGASLRRDGVNGLVYPSARRDAMVSAEGDRLTFDGWNFVDYRGAGAPADPEQLFGHQPKWLRPEDAGIEVERREDVFGWRAVGAERRDHARYESHLAGFPADTVSALRACRP